MAKKKEGRTLWQHRFNLSSDIPDHMRLHEHLDRLANNDEASAWIIRTLVQGLVPEYKGSTEVTGLFGCQGKAPTIVKPTEEEVSALKLAFGPSKPEPRYEPTGDNPDEIIRQRKAAARQKFDKR